MTIQWVDSARSGGALVTEMTTALNGLASAAAAASGTVSNDAALELDRFADAELLVTFGTAPVADLAVALYLRRSINGTDFEDASASRPPANGLVGVFPLAAVTTAQRLIIPGIVLPPTDFQWYVVNNAGQAFAASGNTLRVRYYTEAP
jgi:hypothetical protein